MKKDNFKEHFLLLFNKKYSLSFCYLFVICISLTNCAVNDGESSSKGANTHSLALADNPDSLNRCQKEIEILRKISVNDYNRLLPAFQATLREASNYAEVREQVDSSTKGAIDSLYRFKISSECTDIDKATFDALIKKGETY